MRKEQKNAIHSAYINIIEIKAVEGNANNHNSNLPVSIGI